MERSAYKDLRLGLHASRLRFAIIVNSNKYVQPRMKFAIPADDGILTTYLIGLSLACPYDVDPDSCPLTELRFTDSAYAFEYLSVLTVDEKLELVDRCRQCSDSLEY